MPKNHACPVRAGGTLGTRSDAPEVSASRRRLRFVTRKRVPSRLSDEDSCYRGNLFLLLGFYLSIFIKLRERETALKNLTKEGKLTPLVSLGVGPSQRSARSQSRPEDLEEPASAFPERRAMRGRSCGGHGIPGCLRDQGPH